MSPFRFLFVLLAVLLVAACESPTQPELCGVLRVDAVPENLWLFQGDDTLFVRIGGDSLLFRSLPDRAPTFRVNSRDFNVVDAWLKTRRGQPYVALIPRRAGSAEVVVRATDPCAAQVEAAFTVRVAGPCALEGGPGTRVYFPASVGRTWRYAYDHWRVDYPTPHKTYTWGTLTWQITSMSCFDGRLQFTLEETLRATERYEPYLGPITEKPVQYTKTIAAQLAGRRLEIPGYTSERAPNLRWFYPAAAADTIRHDWTEDDGFGVVDNHRLVLVRGVGMTLWEGGHTGRRTDYRMLTLIP